MSKSNCSLYKGWVTYRLLYAMSHNDANKMNPLPPPTSCHLRHFQNFDKIDSFLKPVLNICILGNLIVGWDEWVIKEGAGILHQIFRFSEGVNSWGRIHQSKCWYSLETSQTSKMDLNCKSLTILAKSYKLHLWLVL